MKSQKESQQKRMFENPILEFLSISGPIMMTTFHALIILLLLFTGFVKNPTLNLVEGALFLGALFGAHTQST